MMSSVNTTADRVMFVTQGPPAGGPTGVVSTCQYLGQTFPPILGKFRKAYPMALGTVQIMIGVFMMLTGLVMGIGMHVVGALIAVITGVYFWGAIIYIIAGALTAAAHNKMNTCLVKASLGMNIVATVTAAIGIILPSIDTSGGLMFRCRYYGYRSYECSSVALMFQVSKTH